MSTRTSIELYPNGCRLIEADVSRRGRHAAPVDARVSAFAGGLPAPSDATGLTAALAQRRQEGKLAPEAWVTIWGLRSAQQFLRLPPAKPADLEALARREAKKDIAPLEAGGDPASVGLILGAEVQAGGHRRREVSMVAVPGDEVRRRIQPIVDAGFVVEGVLTPALALAALARTQRGSLPGTATAYVVLTAEATCLAIIRGGLLLFSREMSWGWGVGAEDAVAERLTSELRRSVLFFKQTFRAAVDAVVLCGDMPNLRALTGSVGTALGVAVQTLDSLSGIDAAALPSPAERFRADVAALRLVIAVGADPEPPANLLPASIRHTRRSRSQFMKIAASAVISILVVGGWAALERYGASVQRAELEALERQVAVLGPEAERIAAVTLARRGAVAQARALAGFETQGPRLARTLETLGQAAPEGVVFTSVVAEAQDATWQVRVTGVAIAEDAAAGQAALNELVRTVSDSPYVGAPVEPPSLRVLSGRLSTAGSDRDVPIPEWASGVEFGLAFRVAK